MISHIWMLYSPDMSESLDPNAGVGYEILGDLHQGLEDRYSNIKWTSITQEFGTFKPIKVLQSLACRKSLDSMGFMNEMDARRHWSREQMLRAFNPKDSVWQHKITSRGRAVFNTARAGLLS